MERRGPDPSAPEAEKEEEEVPSTYFEAFGEGQQQQNPRAALFRFEDVFIGACLV